MQWNKRSAVILIRTEPRWTDRIWERLCKWNHALGAFVVTGDWDVMVWIDAEDWDAVYKWSNEIRSWDGVKHTSSHFVFEGYKNGDKWWEHTAGSWVWTRGRNADSAVDYRRYPWVTSATSIPGNWDALLWVADESWEKVWDHTASLREEGWETHTMVPVRSHWNTSWTGTLFT